MILKQKKTLRQLTQSLLDATQNEYCEPEVLILRNEIRQILAVPPEEDLMKLLEQFLDVPASVPEEFNKLVEGMENIILGAMIKEHESHVNFESELYATLLDPVAEGVIKEKEMRCKLLEQARWYRQRVYNLENEITRISNG